MSRYRTIGRNAAAEIAVKRSRFRCALTRVETEADARAVIEETRRRHWDARHHCTAMVLGPDGGLERSSDDGEPAGTAGAPMLEVLRSEPVSDVVAVVTRWFGGTLLGSGGLVRAYGDAVRAALAEAGTLRRELVEEHRLTLGHAEAARVETELRARGVRVLDVSYADRVTLLLGLPAASRVRLADLTAELTGGTAAVREVGSRWADLP